MRRFFLFLISSLLLFSSVYAAVNTGGVSTGTDDTKPNLQENSSFITTGDNIKKLQARKLELTSMLKLGKSDSLDAIQKKNTLTKLIDEIDSLLRDWSELTIQSIQLGNHPVNSKTDSAQLEKISQEIQQKESSASRDIIQLSSLLGFTTFPPNTPFSDLQKEFPIMKQLANNVIKTYDDTIAQVEKKNSEDQNAKKKELEDVTAEISRLQQIRHDQIMQTMRQVIEYVLIFVFIYLAKIVSLRLVKKFDAGFSKSHQQAIRLVHRWVFNILFVGAFVILFAAEFISFLPFVAILGTAVGLALRDVIYSFIGWFAVGSESGYQEGDFIEFEGTQGRVYKITTLITNIEEYGPQGFTGKIISFPNKTIFEKNMKNWSRGSDFSLMSVEFLLTHGSDIERAKQILLGIVCANDLAVYYQSRRELATFKATYGYSDDDLRPQIHIVNESRGIILRIRILVHVQDKLREQSRIMESFSSAIQKEEHVTFRSV